MADTSKPRAGSMQFWPRKKAKREVARIRSWAKYNKTQLLGFAGYKAGMTNITIVDNNKRSLTKGEKINMPVSIIECPPIRIASVRLYKKESGVYRLVKEIMGKTDKSLSRKIILSKNPSDVSVKVAELKNTDYDEVRVNVYTQPRLTGIGKKKPEIFEICLGGNKEEALKYAKENINKDIFVKDVFTPGLLVDTHSVTKGKGFQGPVKRFGVAIRSHKAEKTKRGPGSLGSWRGQAHMMYRVAHAGQMGYHLRTEYNKHLILIGDDPSKVNPKGGFPGYGVLKNNFVLLKGSVGGARKRIIRFNFATRKHSNFVEEAPTVTYISIESKQGR